MKRWLQLAFLLVLQSAGLFAQGGYANFPDRMIGWFGLWKESDPVEECINGHKHLVTYVRFFFGSGNTNIFVRDEDTGEPCSCDIVGVGSQIRQFQANDFFLLHPRQESNCTSGDLNGNQQTIPGQDAAVSTSGFGGGAASSPTAAFRAEGLSLPGPPPPPGPLFKPEKTFSEAPRPAPRATTPGSAFTYTLPFRALPASPLITEAAAEVPWACNSNLNPTSLRVSHVDDVVIRSNMCTGQPVATIRVADLPLQVRVTPDGSEAIVTSYSGAINFISTATNQVSGTIRVPTDPNFAPSGVAISPDGSYALVTNYLTPPDSYLSVVDIASMQITGKIPLGKAYPESVFINPDGTLAWVTYPWGNSVDVVDILTGTIVQTLSVIEPFSIVFNPTGTWTFVSSGAGVSAGTGSVQVIDPSTYQVIQTVPTGNGATDLQITPDGAYVYVNNSAAQSVTVIDARSLTAITANLGGAPQGSALVPPQ